MKHDHAAHHGETAEDPVCGMQVPIAGATHRAQHDGRDYYFCCDGCQANFEADPARYIGEKKPEPAANPSS